VNDQSLRTGPDASGLVAVPFLRRGLTVARSCWAGAADRLNALWRWLRDVWSLVQVSRFPLLSLVLYAFAITRLQGSDAALIFLDRPWLVLLPTIYLSMQTWQWSRLMVSYRYLPPDRCDVDEQGVERMLQALDARLQQLTEGLASETELATRRRLEAEVRSLRSSRSHVSAQVDLIKALNRRLRSVPANEQLARVMLLLPRGLGAAVYLCTSVALFLAAQRYGATAAGGQVVVTAKLRLVFGSLYLLLGGVIFAGVVALRRPVTNRFARAVRREDWQVASSSQLREQWRWHQFSDLPRGARAWLWFWGIFALFGFVLAVAAPSCFERLGSFGALVLPLSFWTAAGSVLLWWLDYRRVPVLSLLLGCSMLLSSFGQRHLVRQLESGTERGLEIPPHQRQAVTELVSGFSKQEPPPRTPVIVATAGGGIRAAYWTALVLARLDEAAGARFRRNLLALSAVSGGGLGAAAYLAAAETRASCPGCLQQPLDAFLAHDFLSPTVASLLGGDVLNSFSLVPLVADRAATLELAWERGWAEAFPENRSAFSQGFHSFRWTHAAWTPALFINGTSVQTGGRVITSRFDVRGQLAEAGDFWDLNGHKEIPFSTAVHNGARFPYVSPAGAVVGGQGQAYAQIVDGGYFEDFGADTARGLLRLLCENPAARCEGGMIQPIVIQISSEPKLLIPENEQGSSHKEAESSCAANGEADDEALQAAELTTQLGAPLTAYLHTRDARGNEAMLELRRLTQSYAGVFVHFRLCRSDQHADPPLGWVLSNTARDIIKGQLPDVSSSAGPCVCRNFEALKTLLAALAP
jgi:hypothetical protein